MPQDRSIPSDKKAARVSLLFDGASNGIENIINESVQSPYLVDQKYILQQKAKVIQISKTLATATNPMTAEALKDSYFLGSLQTRQWLSAYYGIPLNQAFSGNDLRALQIITENTLNRINNSISIMAQRAASVLDDASLAAVTEIGASGDKFDNAVDVLQEVLKDNNLTTLGTTENGLPEGIRFIEVEGKNYNAKDYSEMVVKTESRAAHSQSVVNRLTDNNHDVVEFTSHGGSCDICNEYDGNKYSLTGATPGLPVLSPDEYPPIHPRCQHLVTASLP